MTPPICDRCGLDAKIAIAKDEQTGKETEVLACPCCGKVLRTVGAPA